eukprot:scaffold2500_cov176-Amphora_coffeaeformis.AAC.13
MAVVVVALRFVKSVSRESIKRQTKRNYETTKASMPPKKANHHPSASETPRREESATSLDLRQKLEAQSLETTSAHPMEMEDVGRKRPLDEISNDPPDLLRYGPDGIVLDLPKPVRKLRLEAIFHPKFENESQTDKEVRRKMLTAIQEGRGYLEVSLKHSGSLLLWSGGLRFYSKNSTDNVFTHVGEILLKQHFVRAFWQEQGESVEQLMQEFEECSAYLEQHRLTLSFEAVSAVTGDHGDRPKRDFLILTAVADRNQERFWGTDEIVALAQRFRLPHNDAWIFKSHTSVQKLFAFYDEARETSYAMDVDQAMSQSADTRVTSMLPHVDFQGDILEGIVIRFVACDADSTLLDTMEVLAKQSREIAALIPPNRPDAWQLIADKGTEADSLLTVNLRDVFELTKFAKSDSPKSFAASVAKFMDASHVRRRVQKVPRSKADIDMPSWTRDLRHSDDIESQRIAKLIESLGDINVRVDYGLLREHTPYHKDRWLCIVHIIHDFSHQKFRKNMKPGDMALFRGFSFEINGNRNDSDTKSSAMQVDAPQKGEYLMLKMKFLPYMVRTFGCRNGLSKLRQGGVDAFIKYTNGLLSKWNISADGRRRWIPFFRAWAEYAHPRLDNVLPDESDLRMLTGETYLEHLERFSALYEAGQVGTEAVQAPASSKNVGLVVIVAPKSEMAKPAADLVAQVLDDAKRIDDVNSINKEDMEAFCLQGNGVVCSAELREGVSTIRRMMVEFGKYISVVIVGCSDENIDSDLDLCQDSKMYKGLAKSWRKTRAVLNIELPRSAVFQDSDDNAASPTVQASDLFRTEMEKIRSVFQTEGKVEPKPGMLVFFPQIPGAGKSAVAGPETEKELREAVAKQFKDRKLILRMGDKTPGRFWPTVKLERAKNKSSLYIADKNVPSTTWGLVASICAETKAMAVPILPDSAALQTTVVTGIRRPDGTFDAERKHTYPFNLHYLAVCLSRVVTRPPKSHPGKLDSSTPRACMIVVMFYCLYRRATAEEYRENMQHVFQQSGAVLGGAIEVPFFAKRTPEALPTDLKKVLIEAVQAYYGYDISKKDPTKDKDEYMSALENRIRESLKLHASFIEGLTVNISESRKVFMSKFFQRVAELDSIESWTEAELGSKSNFIHIASIDVKVNDAHSLLVSLCEETKEMAPLAKMLVGDATPASILTGDSCEDRKFITDTHLTVAHFKEDSQNEIRAMIGDIVGETVEMRVTAVLWDERVVAFEIKLPKSTIKGSELPHPKSKYPHITLWCQQGASAFMSNDLPEKVKKGEAMRVALSAPVSLTGELSFWTG